MHFVMEGRATATRYLQSRVKTTDLRGIFRIFWFINGAGEAHDKQKSCYDSPSQPPPHVPGAPEEVPVRAEGDRELSFFVLLIFVSFIFCSC